MQWQGKKRVRYIFVFPSLCQYLNLSRIIIVSVISLGLRLLLLTLTSSSTLLAITNPLCDNCLIVRCVLCYDSSRRTLR